MDYQQRAIELVSTRFPDALLRTASHNGQFWVEVDRAHAVAVLRALKEEGPFEFLIDLTCVDWLGRTLSPADAAPHADASADLHAGSVDGENARAEGKRPSGIPIPTPDSGIALERFSIVYQLYSLSTNTHFRVKTWVPDADPECNSIGDLWKSAPWGEREVWDQFGIRFHGLTDHRRILNPMDYTGHPLRKDYPLIGHGERSSFPHYVK